MAFRKKILIAILENEQKEQKIGNGLITFKISYFIVRKHYKK